MKISQIVVIILQTIIDGGTLYWLSNNQVSHLPMPSQHFVFSAYLASFMRYYQLEPRPEALVNTIHYPMYVLLTIESTGLVPTHRSSDDPSC